MRIALLIPAHNEQAHVGNVVKHAKKYVPDVYVIDDGSKDDTAKIAKKAGATVYTLKPNKGKGAAVRYAADKLYKQYDAFIFMDADGQHDTRDLPKFMLALARNDMVFGKRTKRKLMPWTMRVGNFGLSLITNILFLVWVSDTQSGFRACRTTLYPKLRWQTNHYALESEMIARMPVCKYVQVPIKTIYHDADKGTTPLDGFKIAWHLVKLRVRTLVSKL